MPLLKKKSHPKETEKSREASRPRKGKKSGSEVVGYSFYRTRERKPLERKNENIFKERKVTCQ